MVWFQTIIFFLIYSIYLILMINLYSLILIVVGTTGKILKVVLSSFFYLFFCFSFFIPFFNINRVVKNFHDYYNGNTTYFWIFSILYSLIIFAVILYFNKKWVPRLKTFGYFK